ncbi:hypothetical protein GZ77_19270 [Endozoicomonas montiporae]|uniref:HTH araC/xylS-type domain-containing protein n=2 Tax=Endozoicomonas montiporae TaxID=1027273 RepID=A0A081N2G7_9GAMM|nr:helix-turn-helix transcriptional regulator [Endozoicomonas montiporae]AMO58393.1 AraC family transcriptional regulator [Endozoicomonas montiporae CL-33]KEQ12640.1 hypothetical protein GZ77_19270 [Endozoicomonas montiporae]
MSHSIARVSIPGGRPLNVLEFDDDDSYIRPHRHEYYEIIWSMRDFGRHSIDFVEYPVKALRLYTIFPGQVHESSQLGDHVRLITFKPGYLDNNVKQKRMLEKVFSFHQSREPYIDIDETAGHELGMLFSILVRENRKSKPDWDLQESLLSSFLYYLAGYASDGVSDNELKDERVGRLLFCIDQHFRQERKTGFYASQLNLTGKRVNELAQKYLGKTVTTLIHDRIILEAHRELAFTTKTVTTIAIELGYEDPSYFCRFFRRVTGESPAAFRDRVFK